MKRKKNDSKINSNTKVRIVRPKSRHIQLRYKCPDTEKEIRLSTGSFDLDEAKRQKDELEAKLLLGIRPNDEPKVNFNESMPWEYFRENFRQLHLNTLRKKSIDSAESRLDIATSILSPATIGSIFNSQALNQLQMALLEGRNSRRGKPRSRQTVRSYMTNLLAAANWAYDQGWLKEKPRFKKLKVPKSKVMKGRPISDLEFRLLLQNIEEVVGADAKDSWVYLIRGLWYSGLRLSEILALTWNEPSLLTPIWRDGDAPILRFSAEAQKNDTEEEIPLLPWFECLLLETPECERTGHVFNPIYLAPIQQEADKNWRPSPEWTGKIISRIGRKSGVIVQPANQQTGAPAKYVSAHDLRRSCGQRLLDAGVPPLIISRILRHSSWQTTQRHYVPGNIQNDAKVLKKILE